MKPRDTTLVLTRGAANKLLQTLLDTYVPNNDITIVVQKNREKEGQGNTVSKYDPLVQNLVKLLEDKKPLT